MSEIFEIFIFTASNPEYANPILNFLDPDNLYIKKRLYRKNCYEIEEGVIHLFFV